MEHEVLLSLSAIKVVTAILGIAFLVVAWRAYRKHASRPLLVLTMAVFLLTLAVLTEGFLFTVLGWDLAAAHVGEGLVTLVAFATLVYSLFAREVRTTELGPEEVDLDVPGPAAGAEAGGEE